MPSPHIEADEIWRAKYADRVARFTAGDISPDMFRAYLHALGFRSQEIDAEVRLHEPATPPPCEANHAGRMHPRFPSGYCVICGAEAHEGCKHELAVGEWAPREP